MRRARGAVIVFGAKHHSHQLKAGVSSPATIYSGNVERQKLGMFLGERILFRPSLAQLKLKS